MSTYRAFNSTARRYCCSLQSPRITCEKSGQVKVTEIKIGKDVALHVIEMNLDSIHAERNKKK